MADVQYGSRNRKRNYPFYCGLQLVDSGEIALSVDHGREIRRKGPVAFLTSPEHYYEYSSPGIEPRDHYWVCFHGPKIRQYREEELFRMDPEEPFFRLRRPEEFREKTSGFTAKFLADLTGKSVNTVNRYRSTMKAPPDVAAIIETLYQLKLGAKKNE